MKFFSKSQEPCYSKVPPKFESFFADLALRRSSIFKSVAFFLGGNFWRKYKIHSAQRNEEQEGSNDHISIPSMAIPPRRSARDLKELPSNLPSYANSLLHIRTFNERSLKKETCAFKIDIARRTLIAHCTCSTLSVQHPLMTHTIAPIVSYQPARTSSNFFIDFRFSVVLDNQYSKKDNENSLKIT